MKMKIERIEMYQIVLPLVHPFRTSFGNQTTKQAILIAVHSEGLVGWGECVASALPSYSYETTQTAWHILHDFVAPSVVGQTLTHPNDLFPLIKYVRGHEMAKAGLEIALWDLFAKAANKPLSELLGGVRDKIAVGVSIGIQPTIEQLLDRVDTFVDAGYGRIKIKIAPGWEVEPVRRIRERHPDILLMGDANSAFTLNDIDMLKQLDEYGLIMIEQPLSHDDIADHARLQAQLRTAVCLDESIHSPASMQAAVDLKACRIVNMKVGRVGGFAHAKQIHDMAVNAGIQMWSGGMLETGIGRATNLHLSTMENFTLPGDISATDRYYAEDIAEPRFVLNTEDSTMTVPTGPGLGIEVRVDRIRKNLQQDAVFS